MKTETDFKTLTFVRFGPDDNSSYESNFLGLFTVLPDVLVTPAITKYNLYIATFYFTVMDCNMF
jgi:hypothetical protein